MANFKMIFGEEAVIKKDIEFYMQNENEEIPEILIEEIYKKLVDNKIKSLKTSILIKQKIRKELTKPEFKLPIWR